MTPHQYPLAPHLQNQKELVEEYFISGKQPKQYPEYSRRDTRYSPGLL